VYKRLIARQPATAAGMISSTLLPEPPWLSTAEVDGVEVTSEDRRYPIEQVLTDGATGGWRAAEPGRQVVRVRFRAPRRLRRVVLEFRTSGDERTQEYVVRCSHDGGTSARDLVRQQWNFSRTAPCETEDHRVDVEGVTMVEIEITPDVADGGAYASLARLRLA
jgi:hypothetical protein